MTGRPLLIDLCCKAGGSSMGYYRAGFDVIGIDVQPQRRYPFDFVRADLRKLTPADLLAYRPAAIAASPPCKVFTTLKAFSDPGHENLIPATRTLLRRTGLPYVIENVPGAPLHWPIALCGSMFGLGVRRHRLFELGRWRTEQPACRHAEQDAASPGYPVLRYHAGKPRVVMSPVLGVYGGGQGLGEGEVERWRHAMGIEWMSRRELAQAVPPAYTQWLGERLIGLIQRSRRGSGTDARPTTRPPVSSVSRVQPTNRAYSAPA